MNSTNNISNLPNGQNLSILPDITNSDNIASFESPVEHITNQTNFKSDITNLSNSQTVENTSDNLESICTPVEHITEPIQEEIKKIEMTFKSLGKRGAGDIPLHILRENLYDSNLICDVSKNNIFENHGGKTNLKNIENKDIFVDDLYIYFPFRKSEYVQIGGATRLKTENVATYASIIRNITTTAMNLTTYTQAKVLWSVLFVNAKSKIISTISQLHETNDSIPQYIKKTNEKDDPYVGYSVAKIGLENVERGDCFKNIEKLTNRLNGQGFNIYSLDITRDFSGTFNRKETIKYMLATGDFRLEGHHIEAKNTILTQTSATGDHVLTYMTTWENLILRVKFYNKWICQIETATVRTPYGSNISHYVEGTDTHLYETLHDSDVKDRGITRIEISIYGFNTKTKNYLTLIENERQLLNKSKAIYINPLQNQYQNLIQNVKSCVCMEIKDTKSIYMCYWGNNLTGRLVGIKHTSQSTEKWEHGVKQFMSKYGLKNCPIYHINISKLPNKAEEGNIVIEELKTYFKNNDSKTYLTRTNRVNNKYKDETINVSDLFNPTETIDWKLRFKGKNCKIEDKVKFEFQLFELPTITNKKISLKSIADRRNYIYDLKEQETLTIWKYKTDLQHELEREYVLAEYEQFKKQAKEHQLKFEQLNESITQNKKSIKKASSLLKAYNLKLAKPLIELQKGEYQVIDIKKVVTKSDRIYTVLEKEGELFLTYGTNWSNLSKTRMYKIGESIQEYLTDFKKSIQETHIKCRISDIIKFNNGRHDVEYRKIEITKSDIVALKDTLNQQLLECEKEKNKFLESKTGLQECIVSNPEVKKMPYFLKIKNGEYDIKKIGKYTFRKKGRTVINILGDWIWSSNIQLELEKIENIDDVQILKVCIGGVKCNAQNNKDRYISISHI
jgi:hypothetical protein